MGKSLEPLIGQLRYAQASCFNGSASDIKLRILKYLLRLADGEYAELLERYGRSVVLIFTAIELCAGIHPYPTSRFQTSSPSFRMTFLLSL